MYVTVELMKNILIKLGGMSEQDLEDKEQWELNDILEDFLTMATSNDPRMTYRFGTISDDFESVGEEASSDYYEVAVTFKHKPTNRYFTFTVQADSWGSGGFGEEGIYKFYESLPEEVTVVKFKRKPGRLEL